MHLNQRMFEKQQTGSISTETETGWGKRVQRLEHTKEIYDTNNQLKSLCAHTLGQKHRNSVWETEEEERGPDVSCGGEISKRQILERRGNIFFPTIQ